MTFRIPVSRSLREWVVNASFGWTARADSDAYRCLHEAGHAQAAILVGAKVPILEMDATVPGAAARTKIDWGPVWPVAPEKRRMVACAGHAVEHLLFESGRIRDMRGKSFATRDFFDYALENAEQDMTRFFPNTRIGEWTQSMQQEFGAHSKTVVQPTLRNRLRQTVALARLLQAQETMTHDEIESVLASN